MISDEGSSPRVPSRLFATELGARVISALVLGLAALLATYEGGWPFALLWLAAGLAIAAEWIGMTRARPHGPLRAIIAIGLSVLVASFLLSSPLWFGFLTAVLTLIALAAIAGGRRDRLWAMAGFGYAGVIAIVPPLVRDEPEFGPVGLLWMFAVVWTTDVAAYFTGRALGGPKLWPALSPKKTWSGFAGGLAAGTCAGLLVIVIAKSWGWPAPASLGLAAIVSALASIVSQLGDLGESALKRRFEVKDSSRLIPGHGGVMDRLDGFWAVAVLAGILLLLNAF